VLFGRIVPNQQDRGALNTSRMLAVIRLAPSAAASREVRVPVMVDVIGLQNHARELLQQVVLSLWWAIRAHDSNRLPPCCSELP